MRRLDIGSESMNELRVLNVRRRLVVSFVGYKNEEIPVAGKSSLKITLKEDSKEIGRAHV